MVIQFKTNYDIIFVTFIFIKKHNLLNVHNTYHKLNKLCML